MMIRTLLFALVLCIGLSGCDSCGKKEDPYDAAYSRILPLVVNAASDAERIRILKRFMDEHEGHPGLIEIQKQLDKLEATVAVQVEQKEEVVRQTEAEKKENAVEVYDAFAKKGDFESLIYFSIAALIWRGGGSKDYLAIDTVEFTDVTGEQRSFEATKMFLPITLRGGFIGRLRYVDENIDHKCKTNCQNGLINAFLKPIVKEDFYDEQGSIKRSAIDKLFAAIDFAGDTEYGGATLADLYRLAGPGIDQALLVREEIRTRGDNTALVAFRIAKKDGSRTLKKWYKAYPNETGIAEAIPESGRRRVDLTLGFWMRRINEGTADSVEKFLKKLKAKAE